MALDSTGLASDRFTAGVAGLYDLYFRGVAGDVAFYVEEAQAAGSPVLELGCGTGRTLLPIAGAGVRIVGLDRLPEMLVRIRAKMGRLAPEVARRIMLVAGDMRDFALKQRFSLILIPYNTFLHLLTPEDQIAALGRAREHLAEDGRLILHLFDPKLDILTTPSGVLERAPEYFDPATGRTVLVSVARRIDPMLQRIEQDFVLDEIDGQGRVVSRRVHALVLRYVFRYEMAQLLTRCGFSVEALYGDFQRHAYTYGREQVWIARKA